MVEEQARGEGTDVEVNVEQVHDVCDDLVVGQLDQRVSEAELGEDEQPLGEDGASHDELLQRAPHIGQQPIRRKESTFSDKKLDKRL